MRLGVTPSRSRTSPTKRFATGPENSVGHQVSGVLIAERRLRRSTIGSPYRGRTASVDGGGLLLLAASFAMPRRENDARVHSISGYGCRQKERAREEIGRASCRERVQISV